MHTEINNEIEKGYIFSLKTWENDYDSVKDKVYYGLTLEDVKDFVYIAKMFTSGSNNHRATFGNREEFKASVFVGKLNGPYIGLNKFIEEEDISIEKDEDDFNEAIHDYLSDTFSDIIGRSSDTGYWRVADRYSVKYIPETVKIFDVDSVTFEVKE